MKQYDVMTEARTMPTIGLAPMPQATAKRRLARKPIKPVMPIPKLMVELDGEEFDLYESLDRAFAEVKLMQEGKMPKIYIDELIAELREERIKLDKEDELRNSIKQGV